MESPATFDVVTVGNYTKDTITKLSGERRDVHGGGFNYAAHAAATLGLEVAAVTRLSRHDEGVLHELRARGISTFTVYTPDSTLMHLDYPTDNVDQRILTVAATAGSFTPDQVRDLEARAFVISPSFRGEFPIEVLAEVCRRESLVGLDVQGFIRVRRPDGRLEHVEWPERREFLSMVDILKADAVEAEALTGEADIERAARALADLGPDEIVLTHRNGLLVLAGPDLHHTEFHPRELLGRSGRGDTCLGSYVASRLSRPPREATLWAAAVTSLKMEAEGPIHRSLAEVEELLDRKYGLQTLSNGHRVTS